MKLIVYSLIALASVVPCSVYGTSLDREIRPVRLNFIQKILQRSSSKHVECCKDGEESSSLKLRGGSDQISVKKLELPDFPSRSFRRKCYHASVGDFHARWDHLLEPVASSSEKCKEGTKVILLPHVNSEVGDAFSSCVSSLQSFLDEGEAESEEPHEFRNLSDGNLVFFEENALSFCVLADIFRSFQVDLKTSLLLAEKALKIDGNCNAALGLCGFIEHRYNSNVLKAKAYFEKALEDSPENVDILAKYGILLLDENLRW
eukprot:752779-Hanusia_phi.AAC.5